MENKLAEAEYEARLQEFSEEYRDYEEDAIGKLIADTGERLAALCLDEDAVDAAMKCLFRELGLQENFPIGYEGDRSWRALWAEGNSTYLDVLPLSQRLTSLNAYANFGLSPSEKKPCTIADIQNVIATVQRAISQATGDSIKATHFERTLLAAQGRLAIDQGLNLTQEQLAALARIEMKSMRNALAPSSGSGLQVKDRSITAASALIWLNARGNFKTSIWDLSDTSANVVQPTTKIEGELFWVPVARDKTEFHPVTCLRDGSFTVGPKGSEDTFTDYREALDALARMKPAAFWRRPNSVGNWGIVTADRFYPRTAQELGLTTTSGDK